MNSVQNLDERLQYFRTCNPNELSQLISTVITDSRLPKEFLDSLSNEDQTICKRACMICWSVTDGVCVPREMQLRVILAGRHGLDALVASGTGSGKTLPMALTMLLDDPADHRITITISPLKRLQVTQESDFNTKYGISTVVINDDTTSENSWWDVSCNLNFITIYSFNYYSTQENIQHIATRTPGKAQHVIVTVEQLFKRPEGHFPRLAMLMRQNQFSRRIARINVDEVHCIHTAGLPKYGLPPFRPAWGKLKTLKLLLSSKVPWIGFSATIPPHIHKTIESHILRPNYVSIRYTSNRENTMYATHPVIGSIEDARNYECFLASPFSLEKQPHVLIFVDDKNLTNQITSHLESCLPAQYQNRGLVRHYHSAMSEEYLKQVHDSFIQKDGSCRILVATSGESVVSFLLIFRSTHLTFFYSLIKGIDFPNVKIVCTAGLPSTIVDALQRAGRAIRIMSVDPALFVVFYESWTLEIKKEEYTYGSPEDPDRPRKEQKETSPRRDRAPLSSLLLVQTIDCLRAFFANYLGDNAPEGKFSIDAFSFD